MKAYIFLCSNNSYVESINKGVFASNRPWPTQVKKGDYCCLYHYEVGRLYALWQAADDGRRNLLPRAWNRRFPFQVKVILATPDMIEIPETSITELLFNSSTGNWNYIPEGECVDNIVGFLQSFTKEQR